MIPLLRLEGAALLAAATLGYVFADGGWLLFLLLFLVPDVSMAGYAAGPRVGAWSYNALHATVLPLALLVGSLAGEWSLGVQLALIWLAHVGFDHALGYGLKRSTALTDTHLGPVGAARRSTT